MLWPTHSFYGESPPKKSRTLDSSNLRPAFKTLKDNLIKFDRDISESKEISLDTKEEPVIEIDHDEEPSKSVDRDSPLPLKNLGNTCYENSIIQCLFSLNMFMDNFERSMEKMRQNVVKPTLQTLDQPEVPTSAEPQSVECLEQKSATIAEDDVRYRIANAFDNLYKSYTRKRIQLEAVTNQKLENNKTAPESPSRQRDAENLPSSSTGSTNEDPSSTTNNPTTIRTLTAPEPTSASSCQASTVPTVTSSTSTPEATTTAATTKTTTNAPTTDLWTAPNLTPIALVSSASTSNEQSEIETRLEELKSAVGERSSQFNSTHQQDASEFFYHVIDSIQEFYQSLSMTNVNDNPVTKAFELELDYLIRCPMCHHRSMSEPERIRTLPLALPHINNLESNQQECTTNNSGMNGAPTPPTSDLGSASPESISQEEHRNGSPSEEKENQASVINEDRTNKSNPMEAQIFAMLSSSSQKQDQEQKHTLLEALNNYFKDDLLEYSCSQPGCESKQRTKKCLIRKLPQVLFITLARYSYTGKKNLDEIEAPFELSVPFRENKSPSHSPSTHSQFDEDDNQYQLLAVVCHLGPSLNAGHYTSYVYNQNSFSWYSCDDDSITKVSEADVKSQASKNGYCFFYAHKSCISQRPLTKDEPLAEAAESPKHETKNTKAIVVREGLVTNSSIILTPESSPPPSVSSSPPLSSHENERNHTCCMDESLENGDDWT